MSIKHRGVMIGTFLVVSAAQFGTGAIVKALPAPSSTAVVREEPPIERSQDGDPMSIEPTTVLDMKGEPMNISDGKIQVDGLAKVLKTPSKRTAWSDTWKVAGTGQVTVYASYELKWSYGEPNTHFVQEYAKFDSADPKKVTHACQVLNMHGTPDPDFPARCKTVTSTSGETTYNINLK